MIPLKDDNPTSKRPIVSYLIIGFCVVIFFAQLGLSPSELRDFTYSYGLIPSVLMGIDQLPNDLFKISPSWYYFYINVHAWRMDAFDR